MRFPPPDPDERRRFDRAVVLFNARAFFEAHEDWEEIWHGAAGAQRRWLQGLIQLAAAFVHFERGFHARGFVALLAGAREKTAGYEGPPWGLDLARLRRDLEPWHAHAARVAGGADLRAAAPPLPRLHLLPDHDPDPLPVDEDPDESGHESEHEANGA